MANVDLKSLFTSEKQYTVLQLLNVLIDEVGKSMVKTASINQDVSAGTLTVTVTLSDDSVVTASTKLNSLTDTEKSLISTLTSNINATSDGVTFLKVVGFEGNETHKGNEIHQGYSSFLGDENHAGTETHKGNVSYTGEVNIHVNGDTSNFVAYEGDTFLLKPTHIKVNNTDLENIVCYENDTIFEKITQFKNTVLFSTDDIKHTTSSGTYNIHFPSSNSTLATINDTKIYRHNILITSSDYPNLKVFFTIFNHRSTKYSLYDVQAYISSYETNGYTSVTGTVNGDDFVIGAISDSTSSIKILRSSNDIISLNVSNITHTDNVTAFVL